MVIYRGEIIMATIYALLPVLLAASIPVDSAGERATSWSDVWSYNELQGPNYWGRIYSAWHLCTSGQRQSPVDLRPESLIYDPNLPDMEIESPAETSGIVNNTGRGISFFPHSSNQTFISRGPLSYRYKLTEIRLHFGEQNTAGSEHTVGGRAFPGELQLIFFNDDLYESYAQAENSPHGLAIIALFINEGNLTGRELGKINGIRVLTGLVYKGSAVNVTGLSIPLLLPETKEYMTYQGSTTTPMCSETVDWIIFNRPVYFTSYQLNTLRELLSTTRGNKMERIKHNYRPPQRIGTRTVRTNIVQKYGGGKDCPMHRREYSYKTLIGRR